MIMIPGDDDNLLPSLVRPDMTILGVKHQVIYLLTIVIDDGDDGDNDNDVS